MKHMAAEDSYQTWVGLKRVLGLRNGVSLVIGVMVGSGIFVSPQGVVRYTGSVGASLAVWFLTGLMSMMGALCFAELGTMFPESGGEYVFITRAFGPVAGFLVQWVGLILWRPSARAIAITTFAAYILQPFFPDCSSPPLLAVKLLAAAMLCLLTYINCKGVKVGARVQDTLSFLKVAALVGIIAGGLVHLATGHVQHYSSPMQGTIWELSSFATAFYSTLYSYNGWTGLTYAAGEVKDPKKNLPRSIVVGTLAVTVLYTLTNAAYYAVLTPVEVLSSNAVAVTFESRLLGSLGSVMAAVVAISVCGSVNATLITYNRMAFAGARDGLLPSIFSFVQINSCTPLPAIILLEVISLFMLLAPDVGVVMTYGSFNANLVNLGSVSSLLWLRYKEPLRPRPIKVWLGLPVIYLLLCVFVAVFPVVKQPAEVGISVALLVAGLLVYRLTTCRCTHTQGTTQITKQLTLVCQKLFMCLPEEKLGKEKHYK